MRSFLFARAVAFAMGTLPAIATAGTFGVPPAGKIDEVNVTSDSVPGWIPTTDQRQRAIDTVRVFLDDIENGRSTDAYELLAEGNKRSLTLEKFAQTEQKFKTLAGPLKFWRVVKITWTKDPARGPFPGVYAAVDLVGQFANVDRDCGYVILYQPPLGGGFTVMRTENNYMDNLTARQIEEKKSKAAVLDVWAQLSRSCPNYVAPLEIR